MDTPSSYTFSAVLVNYKTMDEKVFNLLKAKTSSLTILSSDNAVFEYFQHQSSDLLIVPIQHSANLEIAAKIRVLFPHQSIVIIDENKSIETLQKIIEIGGIKYFGSPIDYHLFEIAIEEFIQYVSEKSERREELKILQEYKNAFDAVTIISKTDKNGIITYANDEFCKISGYTREELVGSSHNIVRHPDTHKSTFKDMWKTILEKQIWKGRIKNINKSGDVYIVDATIVPILDSNENITEFLAIRQDITRLLELEEKEKQEEQRHREQSNEIELAGRVNEAKESFLLIFTHELKTPLNAIINFADYLRKQIVKTNLENASKLSDLATQIRDNGYDMLNTVTTLLDLAKLKSHHLKFNPAPFNLQMMIESQIERSRSLTDQNNITVTVSNVSKPIEVINDEERIRQIFSNLFSNAIKYGKNKIYVSFGQNGSNFWFSIDDNGPGVQNKEIIFELFNQDQNNDLTRTATGTGIGLYFVKLFSEQLGLQVEVERSHLLGGASFLIRGSMQFHSKGT